MKLIKYISWLLFVSNKRVATCQLYIFKMIYLYKCTRLFKVFMLFKQVLIKNTKFQTQTNTQVAIFSFKMLIEAVFENI